jgi:hypothetical protein
MPNFIEYKRSSTHRNKAHLRDAKEITYDTNAQRSWNTLKTLERLRFIHYSKQVNVCNYYDFGLLGRDVV